MSSTPVSRPPVPGRCRVGISLVSASLTPGLASADSAVMDIGVLGPLTIVDAAAGSQRLGPRDRIVLAALVASGEALSLDQLGEAVWSGRPPESWRKVLHGCAARLRRVLGPDAIETVPRGYRIAVAADDIDARRFEQALGRARELLVLGAADRALFLLDDALALWRGRALTELDAWEPGRVEAARLEDLRLDAEEERVEAALRAGRHLEVLAEAQARAAAAPLRERRWELLARVQYRAGRQGEALLTLRRARTVLDAELGVEPGPELGALELAILRHDPALLTSPEPPRVSAACPYLGMVAYDVGDAEGYFGRSADVAECLRRLTAGGVLAVVGASGRGKSSLVRAGVVASLRRDGRSVALITPGHRPMSSWIAVPDSGPAPTVVVDQCEEVVTLCEDLDERERFLTALADHARRAPLVVVLRADQLVEACAHPGFARLVERGLYLLDAMREPDLRAAIECPASQAGLLLEPGLVDLLVREVEGEPGALPLLSHALRQAWQRREGRTLTVAAYRATGGVRGAVANTAEELYERTPAAQRPMLRDLFLRLVAVTPDGEPNRARIPRRLVATSAASETLIERLVAARLVTCDDGSVELAHEALARAWPRLRAWLDEDVDGQRIRRHLSFAADAWAAMGRADSEVYRGARLAAAVEWQERDHPDLSATEDAFLRAARTLADAEQAEAARRAREQVRVNRRLRVLLVAAVTLLLVAGTAGILAVRQARLANTAAAAADAQRIGVLASTMSDADVSLLLAVQAVRMDDTAANRAGLLAALGRNPQLIKVIRGPERGASRLGLSADGSTLVVLNGSRLGVLATSSHTGTWGPPEPGGFGSAELAAIRPDGAQVAIPDRQSDLLDVRLVDPRTRGGATVQPSRLTNDAEATAVGYRPDGRRVAVVFRQHQFVNSAVRIWDTDGSGRPPAGITAPYLTEAVLFAPDGRLLYTAGPAGRAARVVVFDPATGRSVREFAVPGLPLDVSPDGRLLAVAPPVPEDDPSTRGVVVLVDAASGRERTRLTAGGSGRVERLRFSRDGRLLAAATADHSTTLWAPATGERVEILRGHAQAVTDIAFSPDVATLYTSDQGGTTLVWDLHGDRRLVTRGAPVDAGDGAISSAAIAPDGTSAALTVVRTDPAGRYRESLRIADLRTGRIGPPLGDGGLHSPAWRPDGNRLATSGADGYVRIWDPRTGREVTRQQVSHIDVPAVAYSFDGRHVLVTDERLLQLDAGRLSPVAEVIRFPGDAARSTALSRDGRTAATPTTSSIDGRTGVVAIADLRDGRVRELPTGFVGTTATFAPDGRRVAVAGRHGEVLLLDLATGAPARPVVVGHDGPAGPIAFAGDGRTFISGGHDGRITIWDGHTGEPVGAVAVVPSSVATYPAFLPDGHTTVVVASDGSVHTWNTSPPEWATFACRVAGRDLTPAERTRALGARAAPRACPSG